MRNALVMECPYFLTFAGQLMALGPRFGKEAACGPIEA